ncbi:MAG: hypothetical protein U1E05_24080, partial [Patescibacteria group bacterium]|nr:hypothetical protein [Patescibacteria group bacterium]
MTTLTQRAALQSTGTSVAKIQKYVRFTLILAAVGACGVHSSRTANASQLLAGVAKVDVTDRTGPVNDPLYVKALVLKSNAATAVIVTVDAVAIGEIGRIKTDYLPNVRARLRNELDLAPGNVLVNASHCHGVVCADIEDRTVEAVRQAVGALVPVRVGAGVGREDRVMENRRLKLRDGREVDVRHAYAFAPDEEVVAAGPIDPQIGLLRLDREDGRTLAVVYHFACHPIQGVPSGGNTADMAGFASRVIEEAFGDGAVAFFLQGCAGDINPVGYKSVAEPRNAEHLGNMLGLSALAAARKLQPERTDQLAMVREVLPLPRADWTERIERMQAEQTRLLGSLRGTTLNLKTFLPLAVRYGLSDAFPSDYSYRYLHEKELGRNDLERLDAQNRRHMEQYVQNVHVMEELTRLQANLDLLKKHHARNMAAGSPTVDAEVVGLRVGEFRLITFPGELSVQVGLNVKAASPHALTFVSGYTNGYLYYTPTAEQLNNPGGAQEDCDCLVAPPWQALFES